MIPLHPEPEANHRCPYCKNNLKVGELYIPGMRNLADLKCSQCERIYYGDLPAGHGLYYPMLLEVETGVVHDKYDVDWFSKWLGDSYANRVNSQVKFAVENFRPLKKPILLNCLDTLYGHSLLKLLNAQHYIDHCSDYELILLIPRFLRWMVPDGVAAIWTVDLPLRSGIQWNDWLASEVKSRIEKFESCWLSVAFSHPHPEDYTIERFTQVQPFPLDEWVTRLKKPNVTFIWREDRNWWDVNRYRDWQGLPKRLKRRLLNLDSTRIQANEQKNRVVHLAQSLRKVWHNIDFAVAGIGTPGDFPDWITDLRTLDINDDIEKNWCERYARSHVVVGVHGSNMLLPSAHAGAVVELVPNDRWGNLIQDILVSGQDIRESLYRYRFLPMNTAPEIVAEALISLLRFFPLTLINFDRSFCKHEMFPKPSSIIAQRRFEIASKVHRL